MTNPQLARFCTDNIAEHTEVFADSAEPKSIDEIYAYGVNIHPATKGQDSVKNGIDVMHRYDLKVTKRSTNMIKELRNYTWMKDKNGDMINKPVDLFNHAIDAARYAITMKCSTQLDSGWVV